LHDEAVAARVRAGAADVDDRAGSRSDEGNCVRIADRGDEPAEAVADREGRVKIRRACAQPDLIGDAGWKA
jgi:hypothetical protein